MGNILATISIAVHNNCGLTKACIQNLKNTLNDEDLEFIFIDNASIDDTQEIILTSSLKRKIYIPFGKNMGFSYGHNKALEIADGEYFCVLNNDVFLFEHGWLNKLIKPLRDNPNLAIVGLDQTPCALRDNGNGYFDKDKREYVEGSCLVGRTDLFRKFGLFSPALGMFFFEDSDMSLRYRQMGFEIAHVMIPHEHKRSSTANIINPDLRRRMTEKNHRTFMHKWGRYLSIRRFSNSILVRIMSHGGGDVVAMTPILEAIRRDHPTATIELETNWPDVFQNNPYITDVYPPKRMYKHFYDRIIDVAADYKLYDLIIDNAEEKSFTKVISKKPQIFLTQQEYKDGWDMISSVYQEDSPIVGINLQMTRYKWQGRNWRLDFTKTLIESLRELGFVTVEMGKDIPSTGVADLDLVNKTTVRELFSVIANLDLFIGIDSFCFHIAQAFSVHSYILFGSTEPYSRIVDFGTTFPIRREELPCIGCYQAGNGPAYNKCSVQTESCMRELTPEMVLNYVLGKTDPLTSNIRYLHGLRNRIKENDFCR